MVKKKNRRRRNPIGTIEYREFSIIVHEFKDGDYYCPGFYFEIIKPDGKPFWEGGYISGGFEHPHKGLHNMFRHIDFYLCSDIEKSGLDSLFFDIDY